MVNRRRHINGFTLVEVLLASIIGSLVVLVALGTFRSLSRDQQMLEHYSQVMAQGRYALNQIRNDLANFYRCLDEQKMRLEGKKSVANGRDTDRLVIYTISDRTLKANKTQPEVFEVEYGMFSRGDVESFFLARRCGPVEDESLGNDGGVMVLVSDKISDLKFEYYDGLQWQRQWQQPNQLPWMVRVSIKLFDQDGQGSEITLSQQIALKPMTSTEAFTEDVITTIDDDDITIPE